MRYLIEDASLKAYILCRFAHQSAIYQSWMDACPIPCEVIDDYVPEWQVPRDAAIVITHMHYRWEEIHALRKIHEAGRVPVLILSDGILEYRNTWEHPDLADGAMFQPLMGHKIACIGRGQARIIESWGNPGKAEVVGLPRLDRDLDHAPPPIHQDGPFRLLIATANTPAFNDQQRETVIESLSQIKQRLTVNPQVNHRPVQITWRLTDNLEQAIGLPFVENSSLEPAERPPLSEEIDASDAVITTPSTLYLESALKQRPTALLDFHNSPHFVPAAWMLNAPKHLNWILQELADPPPPKMLFQKTVLHDNLQCNSPAKPRMLELIQTMVECGEQARAAGHAIQLPQRIIPDPDRGFSRVESQFDTTQLYPDNPAFQNQELRQLQSELSQVIKRLDTLPRDLAEKNQYITLLLEQRDQMRLKITELRARIQKLRKILGIKPKS